jgi:hypothetical protein
MEVPQVSIPNNPTGLLQAVNYFLGNTFNNLLTTHVVIGYYKSEASRGYGTPQETELVNQKRVGTCSGGGDCCREPARATTHHHYIVLILEN